MAKKKNTSKKKAVEPMMEKIAGKLGHLTGELIVAKEHLTAMASGAIDSAKATVKKLTKNKSKKEVKKAVKSAVKKVEKKVTPAKKAVKKAAKKVAGKK